eukprot:2913776-Rhodomonas_salina.2
MSLCHVFMRNQRQCVPACVHVVPGPQLFVFDFGSTVPAYASVSTSHGMGDGTTIHYASTGHGIGEGTMIPYVSTAHVMGDGTMIRYVNRGHGLASRRLIRTCSGL